MCEHNQKLAFELSNVSRLEQSSRKISSDEVPESHMAILFIPLLASMGEEGEMIQDERWNMLRRNHESTELRINGKQLRRIYGVTNQRIYG